MKSDNKNDNDNEIECIGVIVGLVSIRGGSLNWT